MCARDTKKVVSLYHKLIYVTYFIIYLCCYRPDTQSFHFHVLLDALVLSQKDSYVNVAVTSLVLLGPGVQSFCF